MTAVQNRYDFVYFFDVSNGNPNGDPDAGNLPRLDPETNCGLVTDVCLKRKVRNYIILAKGNKPPEEIYVTERAILNNHHRRAWEAVSPEVKDSERGKLPADVNKAAALTDWMCANFYDVRGFGAVMSTGANCGQVRGPLQFSFARSVEPVLPLEISITRMAITTNKEAESKGANRTMGRKHIIPYGLYRVHGYVNAKLAERTGFSENDLALFWTAMRDMFDHDRSAARGEMAPRRLIAFKHDSALGNAQAHTLFERVTVDRAMNGKAHLVGDPRTHNWPPARAFSDYRINVRLNELPDGISVVEPVG